jgi:Rod binding domain-containing protein
MELGSGLSTQSGASHAGDGRAIQSIQAIKGVNDSARIDKGAREFEAVLLGSWLQQAEASFATLPGGDAEVDSGRDQFMSLGVQSLSTSIAGKGGIGIGKMIAAAMHKTAEKAGIEFDGTAADLSGPSLK